MRQNVSECREFENRILENFFVSVIRCCFFIFLYAKQPIIFRHIHSNFQSVMTTKNLDGIIKWNIADLFSSHEGVLQKNNLPMIFKEISRSKYDLDH